MAGRLTFGDEYGEHVFMLEVGITPSYDCKCRIVDLFEGETYLAWASDCPSHQPKPPGLLDQVSESYEQKILDELAQMNRPKKKES